MPKESHLHLTTPQGERAIVSGDDAPLSEILRRHQLPLNTRCSGRGLCHGCAVELLRGSVQKIADGEIIEAHDAPKTVRACEYRALSDDVHLAIPARSLLAYAPSVVLDFRLNVPRAHDPLWQVVGAHAHETLRRALGRKMPGRAFVGEVANAPFAAVEYRGATWQVTPLASPPRAQIGVAVDIGTTTVALFLVDLRDGRVLSQAGGFNRQMHLGDDVLTRINLCLTDPKMVAKLQRAVVEQTLVPLLNEALENATLSRADVKCLTFAANTTMLHLLAGVDPSPMGIAPFPPAFLEHRVLQARDIFPESIAPQTALHLLPGAAAYVGADLCAGVLSSGLIYDDGPSLLVDVGTNGEIIFKHGERLWGCATAAGPAFEGAGLSCGMRAGEGAISHIEIECNGGFSIQTTCIGSEHGARPAGVCGSAYVDFLAQARAANLLTAAGRFNREHIARQSGHLVESTDGWEFVFARGVKITEIDIARLLQAKAAIAAGILTLLNKCQTPPSQVKKLYLAGGFGLHLNVANAIACGLLPEFAPEQIEVVGNTSLAGAYLALLDSSALDEMERVRQMMEVVELNLDPDFEDTYIDQLMLM
jgi:uncharacterized 2Fe-2S/4Fe-4S cluster protein (DUF4445 family)